MRDRVVNAREKLENMLVRLLESHRCPLKNHLSKSGFIIGEDGAIRC